MNIEELVRSTAQEYGVDPEFALRIARAESNLNPNAKSKVGAYGVMQLMPKTAMELGVNPLDPVDNIRGGVKYLAKLHQQFNGDPTLVAAAYNAGPGAVRKAGGVPNFPETQAYVAKVVPKDAAVPEDRLVAAEQPVDESRLVSAAPQEGPKVMGLERGDMARQLVAGAGFGGAHAADIVQGALDIPTSIAQMVSRGTGKGVDAVEGARKSISDFYQRTFEPEKQPGSSLARGVGQALVTAPVLPAIGPAAGLAKTTATAAATGGAMGALTPVENAPTESDFWREKLGQIGTGTAFGAGANVAGRGVARVLSPAVNPKAQLLQQEGVYLTPGQTGGKFFKTLEEKAQSMPVLGDAITASKFEGLESFNKVLYAKTLSPLGSEAAAYGRSLPAGNEGVKKVGDFLSNQYEVALAQSVPNQVTPTFVNSLASLNNMVPQSKKAEFGSIVKRVILDHTTPAGTLTPSVAKQAESELGRLSIGYRGSGDFEQRELGRALRQAQQELRGLVAQNNPTVAPLIQRINAGWANLTQLETAAGRVGAKEGMVTPAAYRSAVKQSDKSLRDRAFGRGEARNQAFADAADSVMSSRYPDSGTAGRALMNMATLGGLGGAGLTGMVSPGALAGIGAATVPYLPWIRGLMTNRPQGMLNAGNALRQASPYLAAPVGGLLGLAP